MSAAWQSFIDTLAISNEPKPFINNAIYPLQHHSFLNVMGIDAAKFLQGQLSCDVLKITLGQSCIGSHNTAKGRMHSSFRICQNSENSYLLRVHSSIKDKALAALAKYIVFSKAKITLTEYVGIGLHGEQASRHLQKHFESIPINDFQQLIKNEVVIICTSATLLSYELYLPPEQAIVLFPQLMHGLTITNAQQHTLLEHQLGLAFVQSETYEAFIPQMFNYQATPAISFKKGCYTGQEIVARMHYLGKIKRHMIHYTGESATTVYVGDSVSIAESDSSIGDIVSAVQTGNSTWDLLINLTDDAANANSLFTKKGGLTHLQKVDLPYSLNE